MSLSSVPPEPTAKRTQNTVPIDVCVNAKWDETEGRCGKRSIESIHAFEVFCAGRYAWNESEDMSANERGVTSSNSGQARMRFTNESLREMHCAQRI
jgi:hypothetical protein